MRLAERLELVGRARILEAASGIEIGQHDDLLGRENLGGIGHELDPAESDHIGIGRRRLAAEFEAVPDEIGEVLDFGALIIMRQDHRIALLAQTVDLGADVEAGEVYAGLGGHGVLDSAARQCGMDAR